MSEPGWVQLTRPVPDASDCSASNPSAISPVAVTATASPVVFTVAGLPGADTTFGVCPGDFWVVPLAVLVGAMVIELNVAGPGAVVAVDFAAEPHFDGTAT